jgi:hypothetical protein
MTIFIKLFKIIIEKYIMDNYIKNYDSFNEIIVYNFNIGDGGIGDCIKYFMYVLELCMKNNTRLYYKKNNIEIEHYIKLKHDKMYIDEEMINKLHNVNIVDPYMFYSTINYNYSIDIKDAFYFTDEVKINYNQLFPSNITNYISIHLRMGDKYLETEKQYVLCKEDEREFSEEKIYKFIEDNSDKNIFFCCDNENYKLKLNERYNNVIITNCDIGHTSLHNTSKKQVLDGITELYILANSDMIFAASKSGFSIVASKFNNIPLLY